MAKEAAVCRRSCGVTSTRPTRRVGAERSRCGSLVVKPRRPERLRHGRGERHIRSGSRNGARLRLLCKRIRIRSRWAHDFGEAAFNPLSRRPHSTPTAIRVSAVELMANERSSWGISRKPTRLGPISSSRRPRHWPGRRQRRAPYRARTRNLRSRDRPPPSQPPPACRSHLRAFPPSSRPGG